MVKSDCKGEKMRSEDVIGGGILGGKLIKKGPVIKVKKSILDSETDF